MFILCSPFPLSQATVQVLQDSIAIGKIKLEELEAFLGDNNNHVNKRRVTTANGSGKRGMETTNDASVTVLILLF